MSEQIVIAFHTTNKSNLQSILNNGFRPSKGRKHWLGRGVYFYKDKYFAVQWGIIGVDKTIRNIEMFLEKCAIMSVDLDFTNNEVLDVNTPDGYSIFLTLKESIRQFYSREECEKIYNQGDAYLIYIMEKLEKDKGIKLISNFDILCAEYDDNIYYKRRLEKSDFNGCKERQICVKNSNIISDVNMVNLEEKEIVDLFNLVKENRRDLND